MQELAHPLALRVNTARRVAAYAAFAAVSTTLNLVVQQIAVMSMTGRVTGVLPLSILVGTAAGFGAKYLLDKHFIFFDRSTTCRDETRKVVLYGVFGLLTTAIFWSGEVGAFYVFGTAEAKYAGAALGLAVGYATKFILDGRYTFTGAQPPPDPMSRDRRGAVRSRVASDLARSS